jgi:hypothetical protein
VSTGVARRETVRVALVVIGASGRNGSDMAVTGWRHLDDYHPAVRLMVRYMWQQQPPLLPSGFADQLGLPPQLVSRWLQVQASADASDTVDAPLPSLMPSLAVRLARAMGLSPREFLVAAGLCTDEGPLFAVEDAWDHVLACIATAASGDAAGNSTTDGVRRAPPAGRDIDLGQRATSDTVAASRADKETTADGAIGTDLTEAGADEASTTRAEQS